MKGKPHHGALQDDVLGAALAVLQRRVQLAHRLPRQLPMLQLGLHA